MPLTPKGKSIKKAMEGTYGKEKGESVFFASQNSGKIKGTHKMRKAASDDAKKMSKGCK